MPAPDKTSSSNPAAEREAHLAEIRRQIVDGTYETPERLEAAVNALLDELCEESDRPPPRPK